MRSFESHDDGSIKPSDLLPGFDDAAAIESLGRKYWMHQCRDSEIRHAVVVKGTWH